MNIAHATSGGEDASRRDREKMTEREDREEEEEENTCMFLRHVCVRVCTEQQDEIWCCFVTQQSTCNIMTLKRRKESDWDEEWDCD